MIELIFHCVKFLIYPKVLLDFEAIVNIFSERVMNKTNNSSFVVVFKHNKINLFSYSG